MEPSALFTMLGNFGAMGACTAILFYLFLLERRRCTEEHQQMMAVLERHTIVLERIAERLKIPTPDPQGAKL